METPSNKPTDQEYKIENSFKEFKKAGFISIQRYEADLGKSDDGESTIREVLYVAKDKSGFYHVASDRSSDPSLSDLVNMYTKSPILTGPDKFDKIIEEKFKPNIERQLATMDLKESYKVGFFKLIKIKISKSKNRGMEM